MDNRNINKKINISLIISVIISIVVIAWYFFKLGNQGVSNESSVWGTFGDYVGGVIGTIFSFIAVYLLYQSITLQIKEFSTLSRLQREQNTDSRFFNLLNKHTNILSSIQDYLDNDKKNILKGYEFIASFVYSLAEMYNNDSNNIDTIKNNLKLKKNLFNNLILYFDNIIIFIDKNIEDKEYYLNQMRISVSNNELILIAYYLSEKEKWNFDENLINRFKYSSFFKNIDLEKDIILGKNEYKSAIDSLIKEELLI